ncbi:MAG: cytochrome c [Bacteroidota bacterium]
MKHFITISILIILGGLGVLFLVLQKPYRQARCGLTHTEPFCGTNAFYDASTSEGRELFNVNCAACHRLDKDMTGPALKDLGKIYDTLTIVKFLHGDKSVIETKGFNSSCMSFPQLNAVDISKIIKYTDN